MTDLILLAAGASRRFGSQKLLAPFGGKPLYQWAFAAAQEAHQSCGCRVLTVTRAGLLDEAARQAGFETVLVKPGLGQSDSVKAGVRAARPGANLAFFVCDAPHFPGKELARFLLAFEASGAKLGRVTDGERFGSPCAFSTALRPQLLALSGDQGGRSLFVGREGETFLYPVPPTFLTDYDTPWQQQ